MDISGSKLNANVKLPAKASVQKHTYTHQAVSQNNNISISSLALKLRDAQQAIGKTQLSQLAQSWRQLNNPSRPHINLEVVGSSKREFEKLPQQQLEIIALDPSDTFSDSEKLAAYQMWHMHDQNVQTKFRRGAVKMDSDIDAKAQFKQSLDTHYEGFSPLGKLMVSNQYKEQALSQFASNITHLERDTTVSPAQSNKYYALMVEDLFGEHEPDVHSKVDGMSLSNLNTHPYEFLTQGDRNLLSEMYQYGEENNVDLKYIRQFASDLGNYRKHDDGKRLSNFNQGHFDEHGHQLTVQFIQKDQATITDLLAGDALSASPIDKGFISFITEPGTSALSHQGSFQFLQHMVEVTAKTDTSIPASEFSKFQSPTHVGERYIMTKSDSVVIKPEPDVVCKNGHCEVTDKGRENGVTLEQSSQDFEFGTALNATSIDALLQQRINAETQQNTWYKWLANQ
ncbi:hypothetical protein [Pseudoalteromonas luteoviolacea]|uniref:hypothetical protein n=1 Tax=Pseudoalteromonas luteoviolacea TaxID=43657 RepID=UPI001B364863|nr:hypothetical protein [Pseudoalteromonas luteoviolacea]MBQ4836535.1 hypothetical protein [Pseudoalteromonas luteoviolacea]